MHAQSRVVRVVALIVGGVTKILDLGGTSDSRSASERPMSWQWEYEKMCTQQYGSRCTIAGAMLLATSTARSGEHEVYIASEAGDHFSQS
jgi:hypothetical protein